MLKILFLILLALLAIVIAVVIIGSLLPKSHVVTRSITLRQAPDAVFRVVSGFSEGPSWRPDVKQVEMLPQENGHASFRETGSNGAITYEVIDSQPPKRMVTQIIDKDLPFGGTWTYELTSTTDG